MGGEAESSEPAAAYLQRRIRSDFEFVFAVLAAANLGIADLLQDGPRSVAHLADRAGAHPTSLHRLLRALASLGVFREDPDGQFSLTTLAEPLRDDAPDSVRHQALWTGSQAYLRTWSGLVHSVRTGECAFEHVYGRPFFDFVKDDPELARIFNDVMTGSSGYDDGVAILESHDFGAYRQVVDVGGGHGALLGLILNRYPDVSGVLFDAPEVPTGTTSRR
jgi:O-methyltransferase domain/Dimerisation domain